MGYNPEVLKRNFLKKFNKNFPNNEYSLIGEFINSDTDTLFRHNCNLCNNHEFKTRPRYFTSNPPKTSCPECDRIKRINKEFGVNLKKNTNNEFKLVSEYINNKLPVIIEHKCGYKKEIIPRNLDISTLKCNRCENIIETTEDLQYFIDNYTEDLILLEDFKGKNIPIKLHCNKCGKDSTILLCNLKSRKRCPKCFECFQESQGENELREYIESLVECYEKDYSKRILNGQDIDILTVGYLGFEYNGEKYHEEALNPDSFQKPIGYHRNKTHVAKIKGITLYHIWERDWKKRPEHVKEFIKKAIERYYKGVE